MLGRCCLFGGFGRAQLELQPFSVTLPCNLSGNVTVTTSGKSFGTFDHIKHRYSYVHRLRGRLGVVDGGSRLVFTQFNRDMFQHGEPYLI